MILLVCVEWARGANCDSRVGAGVRPVVRNAQLLQALLQSPVNVDGQVGGKFDLLVINYVHVVVVWWMMVRFGNFEQRVEMR